MRLGSKIFKTKKEAVEYIDAYIKRHSFGTTVPVMSEMGQIFFETLSLHPDFKEKAGTGILGFYFGRNPLHNYVEVQVWRSDNTKVAMSWKKLLTSKNYKPYSVKDAMRTVVYEQIAEFNRLNNKPEVCPECGKPAEIWHVDHVNFFNDIANAFIKENGQPTEFGKEKNTNKVLFLEKDKDYDMKWRAYHKANAVLRHICASCNLRRKKLA